MSTRTETVELFGGPADGERFPLSVAQPVVRKPWYDGKSYTFNRTVPYHRRAESVGAPWITRAADGTPRLMVEKGRSA